MINRYCKSALAPLHKRAPSGSCITLRINSGVEKDINSVSGVEKDINSVVDQASNPVHPDL
jgi:hypothetical protein